MSALPPPDAATRLPGWLALQVEVEYGPPVRRVTYKARAYVNPTLLRESVDTCAAVLATVSAEAAAEIRRVEPRCEPYGPDASWFMVREEDVRDA